MNNENPDSKHSVRCSVPFIQAKKFSEIREKSFRQSTSHKIKVYAIHQLLMHLLHKIELKLFVLDQMVMQMPISEYLPHNAFLWTQEEFFERLGYGSQWIDDLLKMPKQDWLRYRKTQVDFRQLKKFVFEVLMSYFEDESDYDQLALIKSALDYNKLEQTMTTELDLKRKVVATWAKSNQQFAKLAAIVVALKQYNSQTCADALLKHRIEVRYREHYTENIEAQTKLEIELKFKKLENEIQKYTDLKRDDAYIAACKRDVYYNNIQQLRKKLSNMELRYAIQQTMVDQKRNRLKHEMEKLRKDRARKMERLELYREALSNYRNGSVSDFVDVQTLARNKYLNTFSS